MDLNDATAVLRKIRRFMRSTGILINGAITFWEECVLLTSHVTDAFGWKGIPLSVAEKIKNKSLFRQLCGDMRLPTVRSQIIDPNQLEIKLDSNLKFPLVIKPVYGASSAFVIKVNNKSELSLAVIDIKRFIKHFYLAKEWKDWSLMVEEYISGHEVDIDILLQNGKVKYFAIADNQKTHEPFFVETGQNMPSSLSKHEQDELLGMAVCVLDKLGVSDACVHFEAKLSSSGPVPIEINLRMGGGDAALFSKLVWGVNLPVQAAKLAVGERVRIEKPRRPLNYLAGEQFLSKHSGIVKKIEVDKKLFSNKNMVDLYFEKRVGDIFSAPPVGYDSNIGWLTMGGRTLAEAKAHLKEGKRQVVVKIGSV
ncbi:MAG: ATP-grasp domain-containing protein [bacterium]|nr:ATP-grasp domain-containing protein [bacterium]